MAHSTKPPRTRRAASVRRRLQTSSTRRVVILAGHHRARIVTGDADDIERLVAMADRLTAYDSPTTRGSVVPTPAKPAIPRLVVPTDLHSLPSAWPWLLRSP